MLADIFAQLQQKKTSIGESDVTAAFELNWESLKPETQKLACLLSLFALAPISWSLVQSAASASNLNFDIAVSRNLLIERYLLQYLVEDGTYQIHERIRELLRVKLEDLAEASELKRGFCAAMVEVVKSISPTLTQRDITKINQAIPHLAEAAIVYQDWLSQHLNEETSLNKLAELDRRLRLLAIEAQEKPPLSPQRQSVLAKLSREILQAPNLGHLERQSWSSHKQLYENLYNEALQKASCEMCQKIDNYNPQNPVITWVDFILDRQFFNIVSKYFNQGMTFLATPMRVVPLNELDTFILERLISGED
ncbi:hypothetical protein NUACC21_74120 [Scytonema sp. NUACC21]